MNTLHDVVNGIVEREREREVEGFEIYVFARRVYGRVIEYRGKSIITVPAYRVKFIFQTALPKLDKREKIEKLIDLETSSGVNLNDSSNFSPFPKKRKREKKKKGKKDVRLPRG